MTAQFLMACLLVVCGPCQAEQLHVVERDVLQSRAQTLILHHTTAVAHSGQQPSTLEIVSPIPPALDRSGPFWPRIGAGGSTGLSLQDAGVTPPLAGLPQLMPGAPRKLEGADPAYLWHAELPAGHWLVTGYSNYYGPPSLLMLEDGLQQVLGLQIRSRYTASQDDGLHRLRMAIELHNAGTRPLFDIRFRLCFTESVAGLGAAPPQRLFVTTFHRVSGAAAYSATAHADGLGRRASAGHAATAQAALLQPAETRTFELEVHGHPAGAATELHPAYLVELREAPGSERLWPAATVVGDGAGVTRYYYRQALLLLPAPYRFLLTASTADVSANPRGGHHVP